MYWPKSGLFQWRIQKDRVPYLVITASTAPWLEGLGETGGALSTFSSPLDLSELPSIYL